VRGGGGVEPVDVYEAEGRALVHFSGDVDDEVVNQAAAQVADLEVRDGCSASARTRASVGLVRRRSESARSLDSVDILTNSQLVVKTDFLA
jgi:hypothetical protein